MLIHLALGDAYGAGFEYVRPNFVKQFNDLSGYRQHPRHHSILPGQYTDDTQMSLAVAEALLESDRPSPTDWARHFYQCFERDRREGYASRFYDFLCSLENSQQFLERIQPQSEKSGACMRALPVGLLPDLQQVLEVASEQARITHDTRGGVQSAQAVALTAHYFAYGLGPRSGLNAFVTSHIGGQWTGWRGKVGPDGLDAARAALSALHEHTSMTQLLRCCVDFTGDVDTVACIALGAAACSPEYSRDLPKVLYEQLEDGSYGRTYLLQIQQRLRWRFPGARLSEDPLTPARSSKQAEGAPHS